MSRTRWPPVAMAPNENAFARSPTIPRLLVSARAVIYYTRGYNTIRYMEPLPFDDQRPVTGAFFVDRADEIATLTRYCLARRNVLIAAPRRIGKSSLILETFRRFPGRGVLPLYVDISKTGREHEVAAKILSVLVRHGLGRSERAWSWVVDHFRRARPVFAVHPRYGLTFRFDLADAGLPELEEALQLLEATAEKQKRRIVLAIDEFQNILERDKDGETVGAIRGVIQHQNRVSYIFSGSKKHTLLGLVNRRNAPFWGQLEVLDLGGIPVAEFARYAKRQFAGRRRSLHDDVLQSIEALCGENPRRIQEVLLALFAGKDPPTPERVEATVARSVSAHRLQFEDILDGVEEGHQKNLVLALAREGKPTQIYAADFLRRHHLAGASFVKKAAEALRKRGLLGDNNWFVDPFFAHYLQEE